jgi:thiol-disulfide isomerase/thioredoxin
MATKNYRIQSRGTTMIRIKYVAIVLFACFFLTRIVYADGSLAPYPNASAVPEFELRDLDNQLHRLSDYRGKVVLVNFWASWCIPCIEEMPGMQRIANNLRDRPFEILAINIAEDKNRIQKFLKSMGVNFRVLLDRDGSTFKAWQGRVLPTSFLLDPEGRVRYRVIGPIDWDTDEVLATINKIMPSPQ